MGVLFALEADSPAPEMVVIVGPDGAYLDASPRALDFLRLNAEQLRALRPGSLSATDPLEAEAILAELRRTGSAQAVGEASVVRPDGSRVRVKFALSGQSDGNYRATIWPIDGSNEQSTRLYAVGEILSAWRAAERRLAEIEPGSAEAQELDARISELRTEYQRAFGR